MPTVRFDFFSDSLDRLVPVTGVVPVKKYTDGRVPRETFPTVYLLHGYTGIDTDWLYGSDINELSHQFNVAFFCPSGENSFYLNDEVAGENYATLVGEELVEVTRAMFPLSCKKEDTALGGFSMGGYGALRNGLVYDKTFGAIFAFSAADLIQNLQEIAAGKKDPVGKSAAYYERVFGMKLTDLPGSDRDLDELARRRAAKDGELPPVYLACGSEDMLVGACRHLRDVLTALPGNTLYEEWPGVHNWTFWKTAIIKALEWWQDIRAKAAQKD